MKFLIDQNFMTYPGPFQSLLFVALMMSRHFVFAQFY